MKKRIVSWLLCAAMMLSLMPTAAWAAESSETVKVSMTIFDQGQFAKDKNDAVMYQRPVTVRDWNKDGKYSLDEALETAHRLYYSGGADGYATSSGAYGEQVTTLWGQPAAASGFYRNDKITDAVDAEMLDNGDSITAFLYYDTKNYSDRYSFFTDKEKAVDVGEEFTLTLKYCGYDESWNPVQKPVATAPIGVYDMASGEYSVPDVFRGEELFEGFYMPTAATGTDGTVTFSITEPGIYYVTAQYDSSNYSTYDDQLGSIPNYLVPPVCKVNVVNVPEPDPIPEPTPEPTPEPLPDASITVPSDAELFVGSKTKHYVPFTEVEAAKSVDNQDGTTTYYFDLADGSTYNYRVSGEDYVTYAGIFKKTADYSVTVTEGDLKPGGRTKTTVDRDVTSNGGSNVADIYLNINPQGYLKLDEAGDAYQLVNLRSWEAVDSTTNNYFIEPDYHYTVLDESGEASGDVVTVSDSGLVTAVGEGTAMVLVTYDAINVTSAGGGPFFGAIWPENTGVFVVSVGAEDSGIDTGMTLNAGKNSADSKLSGDALDAEHDVIYFTGDEGAYTFTPGTEGCTASVANPTVADAMTFTGFASVAANRDGSFTVPLTEGRNIVRLEKDGKAEYQVITAKRVSITVNSGEAVHPGDALSIVFDRLYHPANKLAGVYNMSAAAIYTDVDGYDGKLVGGLSNQYAFASNAASQTVGYVLKKGSGWVPSYQKEAVLAVPEDYAADTLVLSGGTLAALGYGDPYGNHRGITLENGKAPNLNANVRDAVLGQLPDVTIPVTVTDAELTSIALNTSAAKTAYYEGDSFDTSGLAVTAQYADGKIQTATNYTVSPKVLTADTTAVTVSYRGKTAELPVTVTPLSVTGIQVTTAPAKTSYTEGDVFDPTGMVVTAAYNSGKTGAITDYSYSPNRALTADDTEITVRCGDFTAVTPIVVAPASQGGDSVDNITVKFTLLGDREHGEDGEVHTLKAGNLETWIDPTSVIVPKGSKVVDVMAKALGLAGIPYENPDGNYITTIRGLGESDNGPLSGWMYTRNGRHPNLGVAEQAVKNGDVIVFHYTDDYTAEQGSENWGTSSGTSSQADQKAADNVMDQIDAIGTVSKDSGAKLDAARKAYDKLTDAQKKLVSNYDKLVAAEKEYARLSGKLPFIDVDGHWALDYIRYAYENDLMSGTGDAAFTPDGTLTRAMLATILYGMEDGPAVTAANAFTDVPDGAWYTDAVLWANENGIVSGYGGGKFGPQDPVTREQMTAMLYRYAQSKGEGFQGAWAFRLDYADGSDLSDYAYEAMCWCTMKGVISGRPNNLLDPKGYATRAETAAMLMRFCEAITK